MNAGWSRRPGRHRAGDERPALQGAAPLDHAPMPQRASGWSYLFTSSMSTSRSTWTAAPYWDSMRSA